MSASELRGLPLKAVVPMLLLALLVATAGPARSAAPVSPSDSLPAVTSGHRPGPDVLHAPPAAAPQLENVPPWRAQPILVSGASAYRAGEFLYQDYLFDDHGAAGAVDPGDPYERPKASSIPFLFAPKSGTMTYPLEPVADAGAPAPPARFASNAADLVELRVRPVEAGTAFRVTLNTLLRPEDVAFTVALGGSNGLQDWPHGAGVRSPASWFLTVHGRDAELRDAAGVVSVRRPTVHVDLRRRQFDVRVPTSAWDPGRGKVRMHAGVGLWDGRNGRYLQPALQATGSSPGGAAPSRAALFNVAFRFSEPGPETGDLGRGRTLADAAVVARADGSYWRERSQAAALRDGDISAMFADVDFAKLRASTSDESNVPTTGSLNRLFASRYSFGQGWDFQKLCGRAAPCVGPSVGQLQPYALYVPAKPAPPARGWGLTLWLHSWTANHNQYLGSNNASQLGERGAGSLVATPFARGPDGAYVDLAEADVFEVWADIARHYPVDPGWVATGGYSMGASGGYDIPARFPDLFARSVAAAGVPEGELMRSLRHVPMLTWIGHLDEGTDVTRQERSVQLLAERGWQFTFDQFPTADHLSLAGNDEWGPVADFLGSHRVVTEPAHVSYVVAPSRDSERAGVVADHAYWLSSLRLRDANPGETGHIDAFSSAFGVDEPVRLPVAASAGVLTGGAYGPMPYARRQRELAAAQPAPKADRLSVTARNISTVTIDVRSARLSCDADVRITTDGPLRLVLAPCGKVLRFRSGAAEPSAASRPEASGDSSRLPATGAGAGAAVLGLLTCCGALLLRRLRVR